MKKYTVNDVIGHAIADIELHGYDSPIRIDRWIAAILALTRWQDVEQSARDMLIKSFTAKYNKAIKDAPKVHKDIPLFTIDRVKPKLRDELDRRIIASADLIKLNRESAIQKTIQRFVGWSTSIPAGGSDAVEKRETKKHISRSIGELSFIERRVAIDQGHKLIANINNIIAVDGGALAGKWHSHWRRSGYDYRKDHKERDDKYYTIRNNWAIEKGLMKVGKDGYTDDITMPCEEVYCTCFYQYIYTLASLPDDMTTEKYKKSKKSYVQR